MSQVLIVLLIVLGVTTLVGHGIWVLLAAVFRAVTGGAQAPATEKCPFCDRLNLAGRQRCDWCSHELRTEAAAQLRDIAGFERIVRRLERAEQIDAAEAQEFLTFAASYRQRLAPAPASPSAQARPAIVLPTLPETAKPARSSSSGTDCPACAACRAGGQPFRRFGHSGPSVARPNAR